MKEVNGTAAAFTVFVSEHLVCQSFACQLFKKKKKKKKNNNQKKGKKL